MKNIALIFDFDDTLLPDSTSELLESRGVDSATFWTKTVREYIDQGYEPSLAYLNKLIDLSGPGKPLGPLSNKLLGDFGSGLNNKFYPGLATMLKDLRTLLSKISTDINIEFYIVSGGIQEVVEACPLVKENFSAVYGCQFAEDQETGIIKHIKRCVTFTEKTRYLFEINKGISRQDSLKNHYGVNKDVPESKRRVPFNNMIYVGDGLTDIPCFSLVRKNGGMAFGVFNPAESKSAKRALIEFLHTDRVVSMHAPKYRKTDELGALLRAAVESIAQRIKVERKAVDGTY